MWRGDCTEAQFPYKVQEAATDFMVSVRVGLQQLFHHGQEIFVNCQNLLNVGE